MRFTTPSFVGSERAALIVVASLPTHNVYYDRRQMSRTICGARAGLACLGSHRLRHTTATRMLGHGASLPQIAQVLGHRSLETTAIYAKVDLAALRPLCRPWPGGLS